LASRKALPWLRIVSLKRQISTPCCPRKFFSSSFLQRTPSAFQKARRRDLFRSVLLGRSAIFGNEKMAVFMTARGRAPPVEREEVDVRCRRVSSTHAWRGRWPRSEISLSGFGGCGFGGRGFENRDCFLRIRSGRLRVCCSFGIGLLRLGRLNCGGHFRLLWRLRDRLE